MFYDIDKLIEQVIGKEFLFYPNDKRRVTMKMKDFKAALERKMHYVEKYLDEYNDYYLGYYSCMEDMMHFINDDKKEHPEIDNI